MTKKNSLSRRKFISNAAVISAAGTFGANNISVLFASDRINLAKPKVMIQSGPIMAPTDTFWFIPATHWEGAVFKTREQYLELGLPHILTALRL